MKDVILFDLDGTLIEPAEGITKSVAYALAHFGIEVHDLTTLYPFIGPSLWDSFQRFYGFDRAKADEAVAKYREYFSDRGVFQNTLYEGISGMLEELAAQGRHLALATTKPHIYARRILQHHGIASFFTFVSGSELSGERSDKAELIAHAFAAMGVADGTRAVMVGDRVYDVQGARAMGIDSVGVLYGYGSREELLGATYIADTVADLEKQLLSL